MNSIKGTQTEKNLLKSFAGESQARMRYTFFAKQAQKDGYEQIAAIFLETADQEMTHAKRMFRYLEGGMVEITASYPAGVIGSTLENLAEAADRRKRRMDGTLSSFCRRSRTGRIQRNCDNVSHDCQSRKHARRAIS